MAYLRRKPRLVLVAQRDLTTFLHEEDCDRPLKALGEDPPSTAHRVWSKREELTAEDCQVRADNCRAEANRASNDRIKDH
jgi:hypothetical protein